MRGLYTKDRRIKEANNPENPMPTGTGGNRNSHELRFNVQSVPGIRGVAPHTFSCDLCHLITCPQYTTRNVGESSGLLPRRS
jgi:hypothetical protein